MTDDLVEYERRHAACREAVASVAPHLKAQADAELALGAWLKAHRGVPAHVLYDRETGAPLDPALAALEAAAHRAETNVRWCRAVVVACVEEFKGEPLADTLARNDTGRAHMNRLRAGVA